MEGRPTWRCHALAALLWVAIFYLQGPSVVYFPFDRLIDKGDGLQNAWIMAWDWHALRHCPDRLFDIPIQHPARDTLCLTEPMLGNLWIAGPVMALTGNSTLAANAHILAAFVLCAHALYWLTHRWTGNFWAGLVAGVIFSFHPYRWGQLHHMNLLPFFGAPVGLALLHDYLTTRAWRPFLGLVVVLAFQYYLSINLGTLCLMFLGVYALVWWCVGCAGRERWEWLRFRTAAQVAVGAAVGLAILSPIAWHFVGLTRSWQIARSQADNIWNSCEPASFLVPCAWSATYRWTSLGSHRVLTGAFLGVVPWAMGLLGAWLIARRARDFRPDQVRFARVLGLTAAVMACFMLGPMLVWNAREVRLPLPYLAVYHVVPVTWGFRVPSRYVLPLLLVLAMLSGFATAWLMQRMAGWPRASKALVAAAFALALSWDYAVRDDVGARVVPPAEAAPVYAYLAERPEGGAVLELPAVWNQQFVYQQAQQRHWRPLVNGDTGSCLAPLAEVITQTKEGPTPATLRLLAQTTAETIVVHPRNFARKTASAWARADLSEHGFRLARRFEDAIVWERVRPAIESVETLRVVAVERGQRPGLFGPRLQLTLVLAPGREDRPWRHLHSGVQVVEIAYADRRGRWHRHARKTTVPAFVLEGKTAKVVVPPLPIAPDAVTAIRVSGKLLEPHEVRVDSQCVASR